MGVQETKTYVLKPYKTSAKRKSSSQIPTSKEMLDDPAPEVVFEGRSFCFTGVFVFSGGDRDQCEAAVRARGGMCHSHPARDLSYLVVGSFTEPAWAFQSYGRKIETALELKSHGSNCKIISEEHWTKFLQSTPELPPERQTPVENRSRGDQLIQLQKELDQLRKNQRILIGVLKDGLKPADYRKLMEHLGESGLVI
ncbi:MAG: BRCT domain-containing protein [Verrucomicrobiia bacterium]|jgi:BRCT domain type II-containing protein